MLHLFTDYIPHEVDTRRRVALARRTWSPQPWTEFPVTDSMLPRMFYEEGRSFPFLKDVFSMAADAVPDSEIVVYTNSDICVRSNAALQIAVALQSTDALWAFRRDFNHPFNDPIPDRDIPKGDAYCGSDLKAFRAGWWRFHRDEFPDMLIAFEAWDPMMRLMIAETNPGCPTCLQDLIYHQRHASFWEKPENRYRLRGQLHNLRLAHWWLRGHGQNPMDFGIRLS